MPEAAPLLEDWPAEGVLRLRLNRPERHNAIDGEMLAALREAVRRPAQAIVIGSSAPGRFCAGASLAVADSERAAVSDGLYRLYEEIIGLDSLVIAALSGPAIGGGAQLAIASDIRVCAPAAWIRLLGPGHGLAVGAWGLPSLVGRGRALDICLSGRRVGAEEALAIGLVDRVVERPEPAAVALASELSALDRGAVARVKRIVVAAGDLRAALAAEADGNRAWRGNAPAP